MRSCLCASESVLPLVACRQTFSGERDKLSPPRAAVAATDALWRNVVGVAGTLGPALGSVVGGGQQSAGECAIQNVERRSRGELLLGASCCIPNVRRLAYDRGPQAREVVHASRTSQGCKGRSVSRPLLATLRRGSRQCCSTSRCAQHTSAEASDGELNGTCSPPGRMRNRSST